MYRDYRPEHERLLKLQAEGKSKEREKKNTAMFTKDYQGEGSESLITSQPRIDPHQEVFLRNHAVGGDSSDDEGEEREAELDDECKTNLLLLSTIALNNSFSLFQTMFRSTSHSASSWKSKRRSSYPNQTMLHHKTN